MKYIIYKLYACSLFPFFAMYGILLFIFNCSPILAVYA